MANHSCECRSNCCNIEVFILELQILSYLLGNKRITFSPEPKNLDRTFFRRGSCIWASGIAWVVPMRTSPNGANTYIRTSGVGLQCWSLQMHVQLVKDICINFEGDLIIWWEWFSCEYLGLYPIHMSLRISKTLHTSKLNLLYSIWFVQKVDELTESIRVKRTHKTCKTKHRAK